MEPGSVEHVFAVLASDGEREGPVMMGGLTPIGVTALPLIVTSNSRITVDMLRKMAKDLAELEHRTITLVRFSMREDLETFEP